MQYSTVDWSTSSQGSRLRSASETPRILLGGLKGPMMSENIVAAPWPNKKSVRSDAIFDEITSGHGCQGLDALLRAYRKCIKDETMSEGRLLLRLFRVWSRTVTASEGTRLYSNLLNRFPNRLDVIERSTVNQGVSVDGWRLDMSNTGQYRNSVRVVRGGTACAVGTVHEILCFRSKPIWPGPCS